MDDNKGWVFLYGGQGAQKPGMGADIALAWPNLGFYGPPYLSDEEREQLLDPAFDRIHETRFAQLALTVFSLTVTAILRDRGILPAAALGLSAGEFPALAAAGIYTPESALAIIRRRAELMSGRLEERRRQGHDDGMLAVIGLEEEAVRDLISNWPQLSIANKNASTQLAVSGPRDALEQLRLRSLEAGARKAVFLEVEGAFHSPAFQEDVRDLEEVLLSHRTSPARALIPLNILGEPLAEPLDQGERDRLYADHMSRQMTHMTRLDDSFSYLLARGLTDFVEIAPRPVLTPLIKRRDSGLNLHQISDLATLTAFMETAGV